VSEPLFLHSRDEAPGAGRKRRQAVILSGGGANGAYEVGVLKALFNNKCRDVWAPDPELFFGTSIGSYNSAFLVSQWDEFGPAAIGNLERIWLEVLAGDAGRNGVYRFRGDPGHFLAPSTYLANPLRPFLELAKDSAFLTWEGVQRAVYLATAQEESLRERAANLFDFSTFVSSEPWDRTVRQTIDFATIRRTEDTRKLRVFATNWTTGRVKTFENRDMTDSLGPLAIRASSAIPGIFSPVLVGAEPYVDASVLMNTPLRPALEDGADVLYVVYLDPDVASIPLSTLDSTVAASYRLQQISWAALVNAEIERARRINRGLAVFSRLKQGEPVPELDLIELAKGATHVLGGLAEHLHDYRPLTIHRFHPREDLAGGALGLLNLDRDHIEDLIQRGFSDATLHNCIKEGCIIPGVETIETPGRG
jgi:predicted acylesterase/phospholipase RssA